MNQDANEPRTDATEVIPAKDGRLADRSQAMHDTQFDMAIPSDLNGCAQGPNGRIALPIAAYEPASMAKSTAMPPPKWKWGPIIRRTIAVTLLLAALWWLMLTYFFPVTSQAVINARLVEVRAPIAGTTTELARDIGDRVDHDVLARVANQRVDTSHLATLQSKRAELIAKRERLRTEAKELAKSETTIQQTADGYRDALTQNLEAALKEEKIRLEAAKVEREMAAKRLADHRSLVKSQAVSTVEFDRLQEQALLARKLVERHEAGVAKIERELKAAKQGVFIQKDSPYFEQRTVDLAQRIPIVEAELKEVDEMLVAVDNEVEGEQKRLEQLAEATASSPVSGTVWKRFGNLGQIVKQHETLYEIADGGGIFVEALLHQRFLSEVTPGCRATINLTGGRTVTGHVRAVRTNTPTETESACAMTMSDRDLKQVRVIIDFDPPLQDAQLIGRHVRVLITNPEPSLVQRTVMWLFASLRAG